MNHLFWLFFGTVLFVGADAQSVPKPGDFLKLHTPAAVELKPGATAKVTLDLGIDEGIHIQANPASRPNLIPTTLNVEGAKGLTLSKPTYPPGKPFRLQGSDVEISTYDGKTSISFSVTAPKGAKKGPVKLAGKLRYQACNAKSCFFPMTVPVEFTVKVKP